MHPRLGGVYSQYDIGKKLLIYWEAYRLIYTNFKNSVYLDSEAKLYFIDFFYRCLRKMQYDFIKINQLFVFGIRNDLFPSKRIAIKYYLLRTCKYLIGNKK